jgi:hypothetical protein
MSCRFGLSILLFACVTFAQSTSIHPQIVQTYNFQPHLLSQQEITQKSGLLDQFWSKAKSDPSLYIPALRQELAILKTHRSSFTTAACFSSASQTRPKTERRRLRQ